MKPLLTPSICFLLFVGCISVGPGDSQSVSTFILQPEPVPAQDSAPYEDVLMVSTPQANAGHDSRRMLYTERPYELRHFVYNEWSDRPAAMLEPIIIQAAEATGRFHAVVGISNGVLPDLRLDTRIISLVQEFERDPVVARVTLRVQLVDLAERRILATATFDESEIMPAGDPYGGVTATNIALGRLMIRLAQFINDVDVPRHF